MLSLTDLSCRVCLAECLESAKDFEDFALLFERLTNLKYFKDDIPKKMCESCVKTIKVIEDFHKICEETEKVLNLSRSVKNLDEVDSDQVIEYLDDVKIESEDNFIVQEADVLIIHEEGHQEEKNLPTQNKPKKNNTLRTMCCDICGKQVISSYFQHHMQTHSNKQTQKAFICDLCNYTCYVKDRIRFHMRQKHLKIVQYKCDFCSRVYQDSISLKFHTSHKHTNQFSHYCTVCKKGFISAYRLENHMAKHSDLRRFNCDICGDSFKSGQYLGCHKREVHSDKVFTCTECSKVFKCNKLLKQHQQFHKPNTFNCVLCHQSFSVGQTLRSHLKRSHPDLPMAQPGTNLRNLKDLDSYLALCV